jgi:RNA polymerase sigma factor (sigma-70 family)
MTEGTTIHLQRCLERLQAGDPQAHSLLLQSANERLSRLTHKMLKADGRLRRWEDTGDVLQGALLRLWRALQEVEITSLRQFFRLAALQIRRELIDLARHHYGPQGPAAHHYTDASADPVDSISANPTPPQDRAGESHEPSRLAIWAEFHEQIDALPEEEREVFDLVYYQGLTHAEAAGLLNVSTKTVARRWQAGCLRLDEVLHGQLPGL